VVPSAKFADDQVFRLTSLAFAQRIVRQTAASSWRRCASRAQCDRQQSLILAGLARTTSLPWRAGRWLTPITLT
jgi:hypothetical protein